MISRVRQFKPEFLALKKCCSSTRKILLKRGSKEFIMAILDMICGTLKGKVPLNDDQFNAVKQIEPTLRSMFDQNKSFQARRRMICSYKGRKALVELIDVVKKFL